MSIISNRTFSAFLTRDQWAACAPDIEADSRRWTLQDVVNYGGGYVHLSIALHGAFWAALDDIFAAHVPGWEKM